MKTGTTKKAVEQVLSCSDQDLGGLDSKMAVGAFPGAVQAVFNPGINVLRKYIEHEKLMRVIHSLEKNPDADINELSGRLGFSSREELEVKFEAYILVTPGVYREYVKKRVARAKE